MTVPDAPPSTLAANAGIALPAALGGLLLYAVLHVLAILLPVGDVRAVSFLLLTATPLLAAIACFWRQRSDRGWRGIAIAMLLWAAGMAATSASASLIGQSGEEGAIGMLLFVLYGVPLIFVLASPEGESWHVRMLDGAMALVLGLLFSAHTFTFASLTGAADVGSDNLRWMFDVENGFIALFALARYAAAPASRRRLFGALAAYACAYLAVAWFINHFQDDADFGMWSDPLIDLPFLLLTLLAVTRRAPSHRTGIFISRSKHVLRAASPLILALSLLVVSASLVTHHPSLAIGGFAVAALGTGLRNILVQTIGFRERDRLDQLSRIDPLTGLANRRQFDETLAREWARARRNGQGLALVMIDIDHFKLLNDTFGHPVGDDRLRAVATALKETARRGGDLVARYGGEEFAAILPATGPDEAHAIAEAMRNAVAHLNLLSPASSGILTVSLGIGHVAQDGAEHGPELLVARADAALYRAKKDGRDRVVAAAASALS